MTDAELQAIRERVQDLNDALSSGADWGDLSSEPLFEDVQALLEEVAKLREVVEAIKGSHNFPHALQLAHTILTAPAGEQP